MLPFPSPVAQSNKASWIIYSTPWWCHAHCKTGKGLPGVYGTCDMFYSLQSFLLQVFCVSSPVSGLGFILPPPRHFGLHVVAVVFHAFPQFSVLFICCVRWYLFSFCAFPLCSLMFLKFVNCPYLNWYFVFLSPFLLAHLQGRWWGGRKPSVVTTLQGLSFQQS